MDAPKIIAVLSRLLGLSEPEQGPIDKHAPEGAVHDLQCRGIGRDKATERLAEAVVPAATADEWRESLVNALINNDRAAAKKFLVTLAGQLERPEKETPSHRVASHK